MKWEWDGGTFKARCIRYIVRVTCLSARHGSQIKWLYYEAVVSEGAGGGALTEPPSGSAGAGGEKPKAPGRKTLMAADGPPEKILQKCSGSGRHGRSDEA